MRSITRLALAAAISGLLAVAARAEDPPSAQNNAQTGVKRIYEPNAKMMLRAPGAASLTPGAEKRGLQTVDPTGPAVGGPRSQDTAAAAAAAVTTDDARISPSSAAQAVRAASH